jgi:iron complex transport system substrate-binding protein
MEALDWQADLRTLGTLFQRTEQAETWLNTYASKARNNGSILRGLLGTETSYLSFLASGGQYYVFDGAGFGTVLYTDLGLARPQGLPSQTDVSLPVVSMEGLASIKADWFFVLGTDADNEALMNNPLWMSLPAVKAERVLYLPASPYFTQGYSAIGRELLLDEIVDLLSNEAGS